MLKLLLLESLQLNALKAWWVKISADILKYFSSFSHKTGFDFCCKLSLLRRQFTSNVQPFFINLPYADFAPRTLKNTMHYCFFVWWNGKFTSQVQTNKIKMNTDTNENVTCVFVVVFLILSMLGKTFRQNWNIFLIFSQKIGFQHYMQTVSCRDSLHEMSKPLFWKNKKKCQYVVCRICHNLLSDKYKLCKSQTSSFFF